MSATTSIQWTDKTFNPWIGCSHVHTGCLNCYAEAEWAKRRHRVTWGPNGTRSKTQTWGDPLKWNRQAEKDGVRHRVFCASLADVFEDWQGEIRDASGKVLHRCRAGHTVSLEAVYANGAECQTGCNRAAISLTMDDLRSDLFKLIDATPWLDWQLLTKRPENIRRMWPDPNPEVHRLTPNYPGVASVKVLTVDESRPNVWLGTSISDQATADKAIPELLACRDLSPVLFLSAEPLLGPVDLHLHDLCDDMQKQDFIRWVIIGGESGAGARPCEVEWIRSLVKQCKAAGVPAFVKQLGAEPRWDRDATKYFIRDPKGGDPEEWPDDLRVREFPVSCDRSELR